MAKSKTKSLKAQAKTNTPKLAQAMKPAVKLSAAPQLPTTLAAKASSSCPIDHKPIAAFFVRHRNLTRFMKLGLGAALLDQFVCSD